MSSLLQDLRYAARSLGRSPGLTLAAVITLGLGIGANSAMFGVVDRLFLQPPAHVADPDRVARVDVTVTAPPFGTHTQSIATYPRLVDFREHAHSFAAVAGYASGGFSLGLGEQAMPVHGQMATASYFPLLGVHPLRGRFFTADEDRVGAAAHVLVLSHAFWKRHFGLDPAVLGTTLTLGRTPYTVIGIAPPGFTGVDLDDPEFWVPMSAAAPESSWPEVLTCDGCYWLTTIARLRPGVSREQAASEGTALYRSRFVQRGDSTATVSLDPLLRARGPEMSSNARLSLWLAAMCVIVLLIACANVANLLLARAVQRRREIALRVALGAGRGRLVRQLYAESLMLGLIGLGAAILITLWAGPLLRDALLPDAPTLAAFDFGIFAFSAAAALGAVLLAGFAPALHGSTPDLSAALKTGAREGGLHPSRTRTALLVGQVALTLVLLTGAGLFVASLRHVRGLRLGFDADRLIVASVNVERLGYRGAGITALYTRMLDRVRSLPGVADASLVGGSSPFQASWAIELDVPGLDSLPQVSTGGPYISTVSANYFRTMGTAIRRGRGFTAGDVPGAQRVAVVNETMARLLWPGENPLGKCLNVGKAPAPCFDVVGVSENARRESVTDEVVAQYFVPLAQADSLLGNPITALVVRTAGRADLMVGAVRREIQATSPDLPYPSIDPMPQLFADQLRPWRLGSLLLSLFGALGLLLAAIGLYGVLSYSVYQRTQELGIRIALGANRGNLLRLVIGQGLRVTLIGVGIGAIGALVAGRAIASLLYGVSPHDPVVLLVVAVLLAAVAAVASYLPGHRATRVDPMVALRHE